MTTPPKRLLVLAACASLVIGVAQGNQPNVSDHNAKQPRIILDHSVKEQIEKELIFLQQIRPKKSKSGGNGEKTNAVSPNLALLDLENSEKENLWARYRALGGKKYDEVKEEKNSNSIHSKEEESISSYLNGPYGLRQYLNEPQTDDKLSHEEVTEDLERALKDLQEEIEEGEDPESASIEEIVEEVGEQQREEDQEEEKIVKQYDELLDDVEQAKLEELIKWMSIQQTAMLSFLAAVLLAGFIWCMMKICRQPSPYQQEANVVEETFFNPGASQRQDNASRLSSPLTFRNLVARKSKSTRPGDTEDSIEEPQKPSKKKFQPKLKSMTSSPSMQRDYLYSGDTPSFKEMSFL